MVDFLFAPILSLFSPRFYRELLRGSLWKGFLYLLYLGAICAAIFISAIALRWLPEADEFIDWLSHNLPTVTIDREGISSSVKQPYELKHSRLGLILVLDTRKDAFESNEIKNAFLYVSKTKVYANNPMKNETRVFDLSAAAREAAEKAKAKGMPSSDLEPQTFTGTMLRNLYLKVKPVVLTVFFFGVALFVFAWKLSAALIYSLIALVLNQFREEKYSYPALLNVSMFALTAVTLLQFSSLVVTQLHLSPPLWLALCMTTLYLSLAVLIASPPEKMSDLDEPC